MLNDIENSYQEKFRLLNEKFELQGKYYDALNSSQNETFEEQKEQSTQDKQETDKSLLE